MGGFSQEVLEAAAREREVELITYGRKTGRPHRTTIWVWGDGRRLFIRSGGGMGRDWPQNLLAHGRAVLRLGDLEVPVVPRHVSDPAEARSLHPLVVRKYGSAARPRIGDGAPTPGELATFELLPAPGSPAPDGRGR
jgi:deazaflavin-dependent oxidoreductase (nitroreductase family)